MNPAAPGPPRPTRLRRCTLQEGQRILLQLSTWAATRVPLLWNHFQEHAAALEPLPTLPTTLPDAHTDHSEHTAPAMDLSPPDTSHRPDREASFPTPKRRRLARPPPEPPPLKPGPALPDHAPPRTTLNVTTISPCSPRSPWPHLAGADYG